MNDMGQGSNLMKTGSVVCSECGRTVDKQQACTIDDKLICYKCLYGDLEPIIIYPIGKVRTRLQPVEREGLPSSASDISCIELLPSQKQFMVRLDEETYLTIVYYLHKVTSIQTVFNRRIDGKSVGVFASRTPRRLSRIAIQDVRLLKIEGTKLYVEGLDAMDGSPVLDIKMKISALDLPPKKQTK
jgi:tRNA (Thr-GGU) A37 N-methylase